MRRIPSVDSLATRPGMLAPLHRLSRRVRCSCSSTMLASLSRYAASHIRHHATPLVNHAQPLVQISRQLSRRSLQMLNAVASVSQAAHLNMDELTVDLDWQPNLSLTQEVICWSCAAAAVCLVYLLTVPAGFSLVYATCIGLLFGLLLNTLRNALLEEMYKARERIEADLGDPDSRFRHINNLQVHVKVCASGRLPPPAPTAAAARLSPPPAAAAGGASQAAAPVPAIHCYHGFGSNTWSWSLVQQQIANTLGALVTSHDMPGFGLTQRPTDLSGYYLAFNGRLGRLALDYELAVRGLLSRAEAARSGESNYPHTTIHPTGEPAAAAAAEADAMRSLEAGASGSAQQAAQQAVQQGLETGMEAAAAAAAEGSVAGVVKAGAAAAGSGRGAASAATPPTKQQLQRAKRVLMGHSLGGACAALEFIANPGDYAAVVLVAPAIIAQRRLNEAAAAGADAADADSSSSSGSHGSSSSGASAVRLEELQDGTCFTRSLASGNYSDPSAAAAAAAEAAAEAAAGGAAAAAAGAARARRDSSSSDRLDELAAAQGNVSRSSSVGPSPTAASQGSTAASDSDSDGATTPSSNRRAPKAAARAAGGDAKDVVVYATRGDDSSFEALLNPSKPKSGLLGGVLGRAASFAQTCSMLTALLIISALRPVIVVILRNLVRSRSFWANTLKQAYYDQSKVTPAAVDAYRLPQLVKGWETGMIQFLLARLGAGGSRSSSAAAAAVASGSAPPGGLEDAALALRFAAAVAASNTPVLIVHGAADKLVPVSNSFNLSRLLKGCRLAVVKCAGHCPQEEQPELFTELVSGFLRRHGGL